MLRINRHTHRGGGGGYNRGWLSKLVPICNAFYEVRRVGHVQDHPPKHPGQCYPMPLTLRNNIIYGLGVGI